MMHLWRVCGFGLLVGGLAAACTVTSGDDDDTSGWGTGGSAYAGGAAGTPGVGGAPTAGAGGVTSTGGQGTAGTVATDQACFTCLGQSCATDWATCSTACQSQLSHYRTCVYDREHATPPENYGDALQMECVNVIDNGDVNNLDPAVSPLIGCASNPSAGLSCETVCFVIP
jgi:hypothetical protein